MRHRLAIVVGVGLLFAASPAQACRQLIPTAKFDHSDVVVDGEATCLEIHGTCQLKISALYKGDPSLTGRTIDISVNETPPAPKLADNEIEIPRCPQTFEPWQSHISGRFYLRRLSGRGLFAAHPVDAVE